MVEGCVCVRVRARVCMRVRVCVMTLSIAPLLGTDQVLEPTTVSSSIQTHFCITKTQLQLIKFHRHKYTQIVQFTHTSST